MSGYYRLFLATVVAGLCLLRHSGSAQPRLIIPSPDLKVFFGDTVVFSCSCVNFNDEFKVLEWLHGSERLSIRDRENCQSPFELTLEGVQSADGGTYTCKGNMSDGAISHDDINLSVYDPDIFIAPPKQYAIINTTTTLNCTTTPNHTLVFFVMWNNESENPIDNRRVQIEDEGTYTCDIHIFGTVGVGMVKEIEFFVIVPPLITAKPTSYEAITGNPPHTLRVEFQSRLQENTIVTWYKDGDSNAIPEGEIQTEYMDDGLNACTQLVFVAVTRSDRGVYRVVIENENDIIPLNQSRREANFQLNITVPPAMPDNVKVTNTASGEVKITWSLTNQNADEAADSLTVTLQYSDRTLFEEYKLSGDETEISVDVEPVMDYWVSVSAHNPDGTRTSTATPFQSEPVAPSISSVEVERLNMTAFSLTVTLEYTGGGDITTFTVSFRETGTTEWNPIEVIATRSDSNLELSGVIVTEKLGMGHMEFQVAVGNEFGLVNHAETEETKFPPGAPTDIILISSTTDALNIEVHLSPEGTPPIKEIVIDFKSPLRPEMRYTGHEPSDVIVQLTLTPLEENTEYNFTAYVVNEVGSGPPSETFTFTTDKEDNSLPLWVFIVTAVAGFIILLIILLIVVMVTVRACRVQTQKREYSITNPIATSADDKNLDPSHEMINRQHKQSFPTIAGVPLTPRGHGTVEEGLTPYGSSRFKFETASSSGVSSSGNSNQESEESDANCPRYTYNISPLPGQSFHSLQMQPRVSNLHFSLHSTRESIITCPPAPTPNSTNV